MDLGKSKLLAARIVSSSNLFSHLMLTHNRRTQEVMLSVESSSVVDSRLWIRKKSEKEKKFQPG